jgi:5,10-methylenetetrahydrofolate reductase
LNSGTAQYPRNQRKNEAPIELNVGGAVLLGRPNESETFKYKVSSGFDFIITQIIYDPQQVIDFIYSVAGAGHLPIQVGLTPIASVRRFKAIIKIPCIKVSEVCSSLVLSLYADK